VSTKPISVQCLPRRQRLQALRHHRRNDRRSHPARQQRHRLTSSAQAQTVMSVTPKTNKELVSRSQPSRQQYGSRCPATAARTTSSLIPHHHDSRCPDADGGPEEKRTRGNCSTGRAHTPPVFGPSNRVSTDPFPARQCRHKWCSRRPHRIGHRNPQLRAEATRCTRCPQPWHLEGGACHPLMPERQTP